MYFCIYVCKVVFGIYHRCDTPMEICQLSRQDERNFVIVSTVWLRNWLFFFTKKHKYHHHLFVVGKVAVSWLKIVGLGLAILSHETATLPSHATSDLTVRHSVVSDISEFIVRYIY